MAGPQPLYISQYAAQTLQFTRRKWPWVSLPAGSKFGFTTHLNFGKLDGSGARYRVISGCVCQGKRSNGF